MLIYVSSSIFPSSQTHLRRKLSHTKEKIVECYPPVSVLHLETTWAVPKQISETAALLLDAGADINICSFKYGSALQYAAYMNHQDMAKLLIDRGADPNFEGGFLGIPIIAAVLGKSSALVPLLKAGADVNKVAGFYGTALQLAVHQRVSTVVNLLLDHGADPNVRGDYFGSALEAASWVEYSLRYPMMRTLLDHGALRMETRYSCSHWHELMSETRGRVAGLRPTGDSVFEPPPVD